jgi:hypothetical protein
MYRKSCILLLLITLSYSNPEAKIASVHTLDDLAIWIHNGKNKIINKHESKWYYLTH